MKTRAAASHAGIRTRMHRHRALLVAGAVVLWFGIAASLPAAAPVYRGWSAPVNLGPAVNTAVDGERPALSADGLSLYFISDRPGGFGGNDIWVSQRATVERRLGSAGERRADDQLGR